MDLSMKWLKDYVDLSVSPRDFAHAMTMSGSKVEGYHSPADKIKNVVVGRILNIEPHPQADRLVVCRVDVGAKKVTIVTGAANLHVGDLVPAALDGAELPDGKRIHTSGLRGVTSEGMLCSLSELGLDRYDFPLADEEGIFILDEEVEPGQELCKAIGLDDTTVEFEITSNRPDCLSVIGLAREAAATFERPLSLPSPAVRHENGNIREYLSVRVENPELCPRYMAGMAADIRVAPSPRWLRERLRASGVRPINNIVDITNYVMLEYGQPLHAFDYRLLCGNTICVRTAREGECIVTLDGQERALNPNMLVIADGKRPIAVAGVMGGEHSGITAETQRVVLESACFDGVCVRLTAKALGMRTDASSRFEKGLDAANCEAALVRACELIEQLGAGEIVGGRIDCYPVPRETARLKLDADAINYLLGITLTHEEMQRILSRLDFRFDGEDVLVPTFRQDVQGMADLAEEVARLYGYNRIESAPLRGVVQGATPEHTQRRRAAGRHLRSLGYSQIMTTTFLSPRAFEKTRLPHNSGLRNCVKVLNPFGEDTSLLRSTALPAILDVLSGNFRARNDEVSLFEFAAVFAPNGPDELPTERVTLTIGCYGEGQDFFSLKGAVESLLVHLRLPCAMFAACTDNPSYHPGRCAQMQLNENLVGVFGQLHPDVCDAYDLPHGTCAAELDFEALFGGGQSPLVYTPLPRFPVVARDLALLCDAALPVQSLVEAVSAAAGEIAESIGVFDVYEGTQIPEGKKSVALSIIFRARDRTLTDEEADTVVTHMLAAAAKLGAVLRS